MQSKTQASWPQRAITEVHHTVATWLPVTLSCGHTERVNWTAKVGQEIGCAECERTERNAQADALNLKRPDGFCRVHDAQDCHSGCPYRVENSAEALKARRGAVPDDAPEYHDHDRAEHDWQDEHRDI